MRRMVKKMELSQDYKGVLHDGKKTTENLSKNASAGFSQLNLVSRIKHELSRRTV